MSLAKLITQAGKPKWFDVAYTAAKNMYGEVSKIISIAHDITEQKEMELLTNQQNELLKKQEEELKARLTNRAISSGRADDADPEIIANRIAVYNRETAPVKEFYAAQDKYMAIDGIGTIDSITERLYSAIDSRK